MSQERNAAWARVDRAIDKMLRHKPGTVSRECAATEVEKTYREYVKIARREMEIEV